MINPADSLFSKSYKGPKIKIYTNRACFSDVRPKIYVTAVLQDVM
jgi:hypothetical protein